MVVTRLPCCTRAARVRSQVEARPNGGGPQKKDIIKGVPPNNLNHNMYVIYIDVSIYIICWKDRWPLCLWAKIHLGTYIKRLGNYMLTSWNLYCESWKLYIGKFAP